MRRRTRFGSARALAALAFSLPALQACYEYVPLSGSSPRVGELVSFEITDQGRAALSDRFGAGLAAVEGRLVSTQPEDYVVDVYRVSQVTGTSTLWSGETVRLQRGFLSSAKGREFSRTRTTLMAFAGVAAVGALLIGAKLTGTFNGPTEEPIPTKPASSRIPIGVRP